MQRILKKILIIINRNAGTNRQKRLDDFILQHFPDSTFHVETVYLAYLGHGHDLARDAVTRGFDIVVAVGGDGSINEIARGLVGSNTALAIIPLGSGNGLARALKIPLNVNKAMELIATGRSRLMDVGFANEHLFLSNAGIGFDARVAEEFRHTKHRGLYGYASQVIKSFRNYRYLPYHINIDGKQLSEPAFLLTIANSNQFGFEFKLASEATVFDGQFDLCLVRPINFWQLAPLSFHSLRGNLQKTSYMQHYTGRSVTIHSEQLECLQVDGDAVPLTCGQQVTFRLEPASLQVIVAE
ncbi:lipid kinase, YegS/Rv2252/BmrU family [Chitinophaga costaii]|uniref:Lipid kinase, YegS/Rv2252/BmrU family n=1 Tax=Chitinophaga costaii TaxID=1335309 RepID=A0A1C4B492_9BACT|nr:diacylglycerol kinase family protein [Chitinophaga costaii]PUZ26860.1 diacylglycerol kinase family lipid kinase [Chitinophaga costaii]SCC01614.1 lipid kinase, YegS/Rv2252/BmrU family [Chitinophaga costaii]